MGTAMSTHLLAAGFSVTGYDIHPGRLAEHKARGGQVAASPAEAAANASVVLTSLPSVAALTAVADELTGPPCTVIETSTLPLEAKALARDTLAACGSTLLDCPLSGTGAQAARKDLVAYLSGDDDAAKLSAAPVLAAFTRRWYDLGPFGNGMKTKMVANLLVIVHNLAAAEALYFTKRAGLPLQAVLDAVSDGAGTSRMLEIRGPLMIAEDYDVPGAAVSILAKDSAIISDFAAEHHIPVPLLSAATMYYHAAIAQGRGDQEAACVHAVLRDLGGVVDHH
jgi:3-hydroxyisobutyrate dehydrogenase-like beta-hydroxyacid dehydrogenase